VANFEPNPVALSWSGEPAETVTPKVAIALLGNRLSASQIENLVRSGCTTLAEPVAGRGVARRFTLRHLFELAVGGERLALGYAGNRLRVFHDFIIRSDEWSRLCESATRPRARGFLAMYPGSSPDGQPLHVPVFHELPTELWLSGESPSAVVIAVAAMMTTIERRFAKYVGSGEPDRGHAARTS